MLVLIGSRALQIHDLLDRKPVDFDLVGTYDGVVRILKRAGLKACYPINKGKTLYAKTDQHIIETELAWENSSAEDLHKLVSTDPATTFGCLDLGGGLFDVMVPSINLLYMLKMSHRYLKNSPHFLKTMRDIKTLRDAGAVIQDDHQEFYKARMKATYTYAHPKLNVEKKDFFKGDGIDYVYDHDSIHVAVKALERPAYSYFKPADKEVLCDKGMFFAADENVRLLSVLEEAYVLAIERSQVPYPNTPRRKSFDMALMKVCTSITSGWWREYAWENYDKVAAMYQDSYVDRFNFGLDQGVVKPFTGKLYEEAA